ncbi:hypothetical protein HID58_019655, partial [Brassica napus]
IAKSKSKKKGKLNSQLYSPHIDIGDFVDGREDEQIRAPVWRGRCDGEQVRDPLCRGRRDGEQVRAPLWSGRDDELNFDIYMFKYQFLSSYQNVNRDGARSYASEGPKDYNLLEMHTVSFQRKHTYKMRASSSTHISTLGSF